MYTPSPSNTRTIPYMYYYITLQGKGKGRKMNIGPNIGLHFCERGREVSIAIIMLYLPFSLYVYTFCLLTSNTKIWFYGIWAEPSWQCSLYCKMVVREMSHISLKCDNTHQRPVCRHQHVVTAGEREIDGGWRGQTEGVAIRENHSQMKRGRLFTSLIFHDLCNE